MNKRMGGDLFEDAGEEGAGATSSSQLASDSATASTPEQKIARLRSIVQYHNARYHQHDAPEIPDADYDKLFDQLVALEEQYPDLITADSPTFR